MNSHRRSPVTPGIVFGSLAILVGVFLLLRNLGYIRHFSPLDLFPLLLIVFGLANLLGSGYQSGRVWGGLLMAAGGYWLASNMGLVPYRLQDIWPAFLILLGVYFLWRTLSRRAEIAGAASSATIHEMAIFGGGKRAVTSQQFRGGELYAFCGGHEVDLTGAAIDGDVAIIDATAVFGGADLHVPESWDVSVEGVALFGGYEDKTSHPRETEAAQRLIVRGFAIFGGVVVKN
jgi:predicted membrane protein